MITGSFASFVQDQLSGLDGLRVRRMFGGCGLYLGTAFFGIIFEERLFFKTDESTRPKYRAAGMAAFRPSEQQTLKNYFEMPADVLEDRALLLDWAREAAALT